VSLATYADLQTAVAQWTNRTDLTAMIPDFVALAEARMSADLSSKALEREQDATITAGIAPLPDDVIDITGLRLDGATYPDVEITSRERLRELIDRGAGTITYAALIGRTLELSATTGTLKVRAKCRVPALATNSTNWVLTTFPNLYLFGTLLEAFDYLRNDGQVLKYEERMKQAIEQANSALQFRGTQSYARVRGMTP
jgi:hypothetical protein